MGFGRRQVAGPDGIDKLLQAHALDALVCPTDSSSYPASLVGYPVVTVPAGVCRGMPFGCAFVGTAYTEAPLARGGSVIKCPSPLNALKHTYDHSCC